ncbi:unnamed protein product [Closterium sp. NIES-54]
MPVAKKSDVLWEFQKWLVLMERQAKKAVLMLRSDRGGEFLGMEFTDFVDGKGIVHNLTCPYTPQSLPPLPPSPTPPCLPCVEGRQRAAPHSSFFPTSAPLQTLHMDVKGEVVDVLIPWIRAVRLQLREWFREDLPVLRLHSDRGGEFSTNLLQEFCCGEGILQTFMLRASLQQNGVAERRIGLVMEVARTSMIHAAAPHFLWLFAVRYAAHQLNLWPRVSLPDTSPTLHWTGKVGDALVFRVWGSRAFVRDTSADKLSSYAIPCVDPLPLAEPVEVSVDSGVARGGAARGAACGGAEPVGAEPRGAEPEGAEPGGVEPEGAELGGAEYEGAKSKGAEPRGIVSDEGPSGASPRHSRRQEPLSPRQLREWFARRTRLRSGVAGAGGPAVRGTGAGGAGATSPGGAGVTVGTGGAGAAGPRGARTSGAGTGGTRAGDPGAGGARAGGVGAGGRGAGGAGARGTGAGDPGAGGIGAGDHGAGGAGAGGAGAGDPGARSAGGGGAGAGGTGAGGTVQRRMFFVPPPPSSLLPRGSVLCQPNSPLPAPPYAEQTDSLTERREPASRPASPVRVVRTGRRVPCPRPPPFSGTHIMALRPSSTHCEFPCRLLLRPLLLTARGPLAPATATAATATAATNAATAAPVCCATMASHRVLAFDHEGRPVQFDMWLDDLQMYLLSDSKDSVPLFDLASDAAPAPPAQAHRAAQALYDVVVTRYSSPATAALGRLLLPYLFPELSVFATIEDLASHLRTRTTFSLDPTSLTVDLLEQHLLAAETSAVAVGAARGTPRPPFFEGCSPSPDDYSPGDSPHGRVLPVLRLHSDRGGEFSSNLLRDFCRGKGILQSFTLPDSPQQNGIAERRIGLVMEVARTSMIHAAAPHFLLPFAVRYASHQLNLWPRVSLPEPSPTLRWTGEVGEASAFRVWGSRAFVCDTSADKLSTCAIPCVFLGFVPDAPGWQFYHPTSPRVLPSQDVTFDESILFFRLFPYRSAPPPPPPLFLAPTPPSIDPLPPQGPAPSGVSQVTLSLPGGAESEGAESGCAEPVGVEPGGPAGALPRLSPEQLHEWLARRARLQRRDTTTGGAGDAGAGVAGVTAGAGDTGGTAAAGPRVARTKGAGAAGTGGVGGAGAGDPTELGPAAGGGSCAGGAGAGGAGAGGDGVGDTGAGGAGAAGAGAVDPGAGGDVGTVRSQSYFFLLLQQDLGVPGLTEHREPASCPVSPVRTAHRVPHSRPPRVLSTHSMALRPSSVPMRVPLSAPPESSLPEVPDPESDRARAASPTVSCLLATALTDPSFESAAVSALVVELLDFAAACRLDYATSLVAESASASPPSIGGECALGTDVLEDRQEDFECLAAAVPRFASMLLAPKGDPDAPDIPTPRSYVEAITGPYSSQWQAAMDVEMASLKSTGTYIDEVPPPGANIVDGMWIFRVKLPLGSPPAFKARYVARGFSQRQGVDYFQTFSPTPKMTTLRYVALIPCENNEQE